MNQPSKTIETVWVRLVRAHHHALSRIEADLKKAGLPALGWYDALLELERAGECGLRPFELEQQLLLPQYGLSRLLQRLELAGYVTRWRCEEDGRGQVVSITDQGRDVRGRMWPVYAAALQDVLGEKLDDQQAEQLAGLLGRLLE
jgi:DNA-binding MarR family transcriptional regulator